MLTHNKATQHLNFQLLFADNCALFTNNERLSYVVVNHIACEIEVLAHNRFASSITI